MSMCVGRRKQMPYAEQLLLCVRNRKWSSVSQLNKSEGRNNMFFLVCLFLFFFFFVLKWIPVERAAQTLHASLHALTANILMWLQYTILNTLTLYILIIHPSSLLGFVGLLWQMNLLYSSLIVLGGLNNCSD